MSGIRNALSGKGIREYKIHPDRRIRQLGAIGRLAARTSGAQNRTVTVDRHCD
jgi:hypothetical protein